MHITSDLISRVDRFSAPFHTAHMGALATLPGNPFGVEVRALGEGTAVKVRHPLLRSKNRVVGFQPSDLSRLDELTQFYRDDRLRFTLTVPPGQTTPELFTALVQAGLWTSGSGTVPAILPGGLFSAPAGIVVRRSELEEKEPYLDLFQQAFADREESSPEYRAFQWAEDTLPGGVRYIAEIDGKPIAMASFPIVGGIGFLGTCGVLPEYRRRGVQSALIARRVADAPALGCDLILGGGSPGTICYRNFERAGLRLVPTGSLWQEAPTQK